MTDMNAVKRDENTKTVLVVEDSMVQAVSLGQLLLKHGLSVLHAPDGRSGIFVAQRYLPDAIILDLEMPHMNGLQACMRLKADPKTAHIPIVILTQHGDEAELINQALDYGAVDYIPKDSFANAVLVETLRQMSVLHALDGQETTVEA
jgi:CheY-like chemotaxis protein